MVEDLPFTRFLVITVDIEGCSCSDSCDDAATGDECSADNEDGDFLKGIALRLLGRGNSKLQLVSQAHVHMSLTDPFSNNDANAPAGRARQVARGQRRCNPR